MENAIQLEAQKILGNMALDLHLHSAVQPIGFILAKIFGVFGIILKIF
jgi:hypothetical protein